MDDFFALHFEEARIQVSNNNIPVALEQLELASLQLKIIENISNLTFPSGFKRIQAGYFADPTRYEEQIKRCGVSTSEVFCRE